MSSYSITRLCGSILRFNGNRCIASSIVITPNRNISGRTMRNGPLVRPPPFPYQQKKLNYLRCFIDNPMKRMDENSKIIVVEGNIGCGKTTLAKKLAEELEMLYLPEVNMDMLYINDYGYDLRSLNHKFPDSLKLCDIEEFYKNPKHPRVGTFQFFMFYLRIEQYLDAMAHLMNTGQGVILERCAYSDFVFVETMVQHGHLSKLAKDFIYQIKDLTVPSLLRPHLVIYLDTPVSTILERIKKRNIKGEVDSKVLTPDYLSSIEYQYKEKYLPEINIHSELLMYDWTEIGEPEMVVDDIERIDFDQYDKYDKKMKDWDMDRWDMAEKRYEVTHLRDRILTQFDIHSEKFIPGITYTADEGIIYEEVSESLPGNKYATGYNTDLGDGSVYLKHGEHEKYYTILGREKKK